MEDENKDVDMIDESSIKAEHLPSLEPKIEDTKYMLKIKTLGNISKLFIQYSLLIILLTILIGIHNPDFSKLTLELLWDKLGAVYLVIFGSVLGGGKE